MAISEVVVYFNCRSAIANSDVMIQFAVFQNIGFSFLLNCQDSDQFKITL